MPNSNPYYANAPKTIDIRMYDQLVVAHNKLSGKLSDANAHVGVLEGQINQCNEDLIAAFELMKQVRGLGRVVKGLGLGLGLKEDSSGTGECMVDGRRQHGGRQLGVVAKV